MGHFRNSTLLIALALIVPGALAETEVALQTGVRFGETDQEFPVYGLTFDFELAPERWLSAIWSMQDTEIHRDRIELDDGVLELNVHYLEFAGVYRPTTKGSARSFVTAGAGVAWVSPQDSNFSDELSLTLMVGGGTIVPLGKRTGLRFDARGHFILTDIRLDGVCGGVGCSVNFSSGGAVQFEGLIGLSIGF